MLQSLPPPQSRRKGGQRKKCGYKAGYEGVRVRVRVGGRPAKIRVPESWHSTIQWQGAEPHSATIQNQANIFQFIQNKCRVKIFPWACLCLPICFLRPNRCSSHTKWILLNHCNYRNNLKAPLEQHLNPDQCNKQGDNMNKNKSTRSQVTNCYAYSDILTIPAIMLYDGLFKMMVFDSHHNC